NGREIINSSEGGAKHGCNCRTCATACGGARHRVGRRFFQELERRRSTGRDEGLGNNPPHYRRGWVEKLRGSQGWQDYRVPREPQSSVHCGRERDRRSLAMRRPWRGSTKAGASGVKSRANKSGGANKRVVLLAPSQGTARERPAGS